MLIRFITACFFGFVVFLHILAGMIKATMVFPFLCREKRNGQIRKWSMELLRLLGVQTVFRGCVTEAMKRPVMLIANHVSWLDICLLNSATPARFVAKAEVGGWPFIGVLARASRSFFLRRGCSKDVLRVKQDMTAALRGGEHIAFFAEGTTTDGNRVLRFHSGLIESAVQAGACVCPVAIRYQFEGDVVHGCPAAFVGDMTFLESMARILMYRGMTAEVVYTPLIPATGVSRRGIAATSRDAIAVLLERKAVASSPARKEIGEREVGETRIFGTA